MNFCGITRVLQGSSTQDINPFPFLSGRQKAEVIVFKTDNLKAKRVYSHTQYGGASFLLKQSLLNPLAGSKQNRQLETWTNGVFAHQLLWATSCSLWGHFLLRHPRLPNSKYAPTSASGLPNFNHKNGAAFDEK